jgi:hypothetical protein
MTTHTTENIPPDDVLSGALGKLRRVVVVGEELDGTYWFSTSTGDRAEAYWLLQRMAAQLMHEETSTWVSEGE